jgi:hypothetical protein
MEAKIEEMPSQE